MVTPDLEVTDPSDLDRLQMNYMNSSHANQTSIKTDEKSVQNLREKQLKFEVEILELELELQMNEEELLSDEDTENLTNKLVYVKAPQSASKKLMENQIPLQNPKLSSFASGHLPIQATISASNKKEQKKLLTSPGKQHE